MKDAILIGTKNQMPFLRPGIVKRKRIEKRLADSLLDGDGFIRKLTLIAAPAGYGKTSLAVSWLWDITVKSCWVSIDAGDNDPARFFAYVISALQTVNEDIGQETLAALRSPQLPPPEALIGPLINAISDHRTPMILALDDYHLIETMVVHRAMNFLIKNIPRNLHVVIVSREDPPFPLHELRAKGQMVEVRQKDLTFREGETAALFKYLSDRPISENEAHLIHEQTEGWVTGIQLTVLAFQNRQEKATAMKDMGKGSSYILDYLFKEIFQSQSDALQDFLMKTSILAQFTPELANAVSGHSESGAMIDSLYQSNMFINPIEEGGNCYRYHRLFRDLLRKRLQMESSIEPATLHLKASEWYERRGSMRESIQHSLDGRHWERAAGQIGAASDQMLKNGRLTTLLSWMGMLPDALFNHSADLCLVYIWPLMLSGQLEKADGFIKRALSGTKDGTETMGHIAAAQAYLAQVNGAREDLVRYSEKALALLPATDQSSRGIVSLNLGMAHWHDGEMERAREPLAEALPIAERSGNVYAEVSARLFLARIEAVAGKLAEAAGITEKLVKNQKGVPIENLALTDMAMYHYEWNELEKAHEYIDTALAHLKKGSIAGFKLAALMIKMRILMAMGSAKDLQLVHETCEELLSDNSISEAIRARWATLNVETAIYEGNIASARHWLARCDAPVDAHPFYRFLQLSPIRIYIAEGQTEKAENTLRQANKRAAKMGWVYGQVWLLTRLALVTADAQQRLECVRKAVEIGECGNMVRTFTEAGQELVPLLEEMRSGSAKTAYIDKLLQEFADNVQRTLSEEREQVLSERELEVLQLVSAGLSNQQIAEKLVISISTVKSHIHHIYNKLDATNRTQASAKAREMGIIP